MRAASLLAAAAGVLLAGAAHAAVISANVNQPLGSFTLSLGTTPSTFVFTAMDSGGNGPGAAVSTTGGATVSMIFGGIADFGAGSSIDQTGELYTFAAQGTAALIPNSAADDYIGLAFTLPDGVHYGYAEVSGASVVSYGYESTAGASIITGAVPEPASVALLLAGLTGLAVIRNRRA